MAFDPFGGGGAANQGSHVVFASVRTATFPEQSSPAALQPSFGDALQRALAERNQETQGPASQSVPASNAQAIGASAEEVAKAVRNVVFVFDGIASPHRRTEQARRQEEERLAAAAVNAQTLIAAEEALNGTSTSASLGIAKRLPGSPADGYRYMETLRHDQQITDERRAVARKMAQKDDEMAFRD